LCAMKSTSIRPMPWSSLQYQTLTRRRNDQLITMSCQLIKTEPRINAPVYGASVCHPLGSRNYGCAAGIV